VINDYSQYIVPHRSAKDDAKVGWLKETVQDAEVYLKSQRNYRDIDKSIDILSGHGNDRLPKGMSTVHLNMVGRDFKEAVAVLANMRPMWGYKTDNSEFRDLATILDKMLLSWYLNTFADRSIRQAIQYAMGATKGWICPQWKSDFWVTGRGDIKLNVKGPRDVLPFQIGSDHDIQAAYAVTIRDEVPFAKAIATYPTKLDILSPTRSTPTWMRKGIRRVQKFLSPVLNQFGPGRGGDNDEALFPTIDIYRTYVMDLTYNDGSEPITMGIDGTSWSYTVPPKDSDIATGEYVNGQQLYRKATLEDSLIYPLRRLIIWTENGTLYDDTATDWHGKVPAIPFDMNDLPWDFLNRSLPSEGASVQESNTNLMRAIDDSANCRLDPAMAYDENMMSEALMQRLNLRKPGQRLKVNMQMGDGAKPLLPPGYYDVPSWITQYVDGMWEKMHYVMGTRDIAGLAKSKILSGDTLEKAVELAGPIITDMSRGMERSMRELGEMWKALAMQYYNLPRRVQILGQDGVTETDFDYDPGSMIPSHLPDEFALIKKGAMSKNTPSRANIVQRAKAHINSVYFHVTPNSLHQITQLTRKMLYLQLWKGQFPIDPITMAEVLDIPNFGDAALLAKAIDSEHTPKDVLGRWIAWRELLSKLQPQQGQPGRKGSGQQAGQIRQKDGGTRSTVAESAR